MPSLSIDNHDAREVLDGYYSDVGDLGARNTFNEYDALPDLWLGHSVRSAIAEAILALISESPSPLIGSK
jgi:hypothetical protein